MIPGVWKEFIFISMWGIRAIFLGFFLYYISNVCTLKNFGKCLHLVWYLKIIRIISRFLLLKVTNIGIITECVTKVDKLIKLVCGSLKERSFNASITLLAFKNHLCLTISAPKNEAHKNIH